jgi:hypothetical protein
VTVANLKSLNFQVNDNDIMGFILQRNLAYGVFKR